MEIKNRQEFDKALKSDKIVLVDFWAEWCGPCKVVSNTLKEVFDDVEIKEKAILVKINVDLDTVQEIVSEYSIRNIPTILFFKNGNVADKAVGAQSKQVLIDKINSL